jgi:glycosyltransferase involved in cell wall biosynthesis
VYNEEALLPHFLAHYAPIADRIVVWDNGSTDATPQIAQAHSKVERGKVLPAAASMNVGSKSKRSRRTLMERCRSSGLEGG